MRMIYQDVTGLFIYMDSLLAGVYLGVVFMSGVLIAVLYPRRSNPTVKYLMLSSGLGLVVSILYIMLLFVQGWIVYYLLHFRFVSLVGVLVFVFLFASYYSNSEFFTHISVRLVMYGYVVGLSFIPLVFPEFSLLTVDMTANDLGVFSFSYTFTDIGGFNLAVAYIIIFATAVLLLSSIFSHSYVDYVVHGLFILIAISIPVSFSLMYRYSSFGYDLTPVGWGLSSLLLTGLIVRYPAVGLSPVTEKKIKNVINDGILIVDGRTEEVVDSNEMAVDILGIEGELVGRSIESIFDFQGADVVLERLELLNEGESNVDSEVVYISSDDMYVDVGIHGLTSYDDSVVGWLLTLRDVTERVEQRTELEKKIESLDSFASVVSHDLRNPLNIAQVAIYNTKAMDELSHLDQAEDALDRMEIIIEDVLTVSRNPNDEIELSPVTLSNVVLSSWDTVETKNVELDIQFEPDTVLLANAQRLARLFENAFRNSVEHAFSDSDVELEEKPRITVGVRELDSHTGDEFSSTGELIISDNGTGLDSSKTTGLFDSGVTFSNDGTGLGLSIVKKISDEHNWNPRVETDIGEGFSIIIDDVVFSVEDS